jgi:hypothetical protein
MINDRLNERNALVIGPFLIRIEDPDSKLNLPDKAYQFLEQNASDQPKQTFEYIINEEDYCTESEDILMAEFKKGPVPFSIYRKKTGESLWIRRNVNDEIQLVYKISEDWSCWRMIADKSGSKGRCGFEELSYIFPYSILNKGGILFHGVVMEWEGMGIIVGAHSGVGKTTHTKMWKEYEDAVILNGDRALCYRKEGCWYTCGAPWNGSSGECSNREIAISVIVILEQAGNNQVTYLTPLQGAMELIKLTFAPTWESDLMNCALDSIDQVVKNIRVIKLSCRPDLDAVKVLKDEIKGLWE